MSNLKYENLVLKCDPEWLIKSQPHLYFRGASQIPGAGYNVGYGYIYEPIVMDPNPHRHWNPECLIFSSSTLKAKDWDADIEIQIGVGDDMEIYKVDEPMTFYIPTGVWHCPINFKRVEKPVWFQPACFIGMFGATYLMPDGTEKDNYFNGTIMCVLGEDKKCDCCRKCLTRSWEKVSQE